MVKLFGTLPKVFSNITIFFYHIFTDQTRFNINARTTLTARVTIT